jgi:hypothetical protein
MVEAIYQANSLDERQRCAELRVLCTIAGE